jgi:hypothetical protein
VDCRQKPNRFRNIGGRFAVASPQAGPYFQVPDTRYEDFTARPSRVVTGTPVTKLFS